MPDKMTTPYDSVSYPGRAYQYTHPDRLATLAALYGMDPAPVARCRVLELGCGVGSNLIPMAYQYPESQFIGIDLSRGEIEQGMTTVGALGLENIELRHCDIMEVTAEYGCFDYIIAHGVYSWVLAAVQEKMLAIFAANLAPQGVAYVSYNAYPGSHLRDLARDMMLFHVREITDPQMRIRQARAILNFLADASATNWHGAVMREQLDRVTESTDELLYHDDLDAVGKAFLLHQVVADARRHQLQYLCDAQLSRRDLQRYSEAVRNVLKQFPDSQFMERDQYQDFIEGHSFCRTLLCHSDVLLDRTAEAGRIKRFHLASSAVPVAGDINLRDDSVAEFKTPEGHTLATGHPLSKAALIHLQGCWPAAVGFAELLEHAGRLVTSANGQQQLSEENIAMSAEALWQAASSGCIELHLHPPRLATAIGERPQASPIARRQAGRKTPVTNLRHRTIELEDEAGRHFLMLVDGTRNVDELVADLSDTLVRTGLSRAGHPVTRAHVERHLRILANQALLVG